MRAMSILLSDISLISCTLMLASKAKTSTSGMVPFRSRSGFISETALYRYIDCMNFQVQKGKIQWFGRADEEIYHFDVCVRFRRRD